MAFQTVFRRYEIKYMLSRDQKERLLEYMKPYMAGDKYGHTSIRNIYYDTDDHRLVRHSEEKPVYKEKLRVRSYGRADESSTVFVELKKKYDSVVYKRRTAMSEQEAENWLVYGEKPAKNSQINSEIEYFRQFYETLAPKVFLSYERDAFYGEADDLRATFDENILARTDRLSLCEKNGGIPLIGADEVLLELKTARAIPLWLTAFLTENRIFKTSFSKYGTAYRNIIMAEKGEKQYVC